MSQELAAALTLRMERVIRAPRERVFDAWTQFGDMRKWLAPTPLTVPEGSIDLRVGGTFTATMVRPDGTMHIMRGKYLEIDRPVRLVYTHAWVRDNGRSELLTPDTIVTLEFHEEGDATRVVLTQTGFADKANCDSHEGGWSGSFRNLTQLLEIEQ